MQSWQLRICERLKTIYERLQVRLLKKPGAEIIKHSVAVLDRAAPCGATKRLNVRSGECDDDLVSALFGDHHFPLEIRKQARRSRSASLTLI